MARLTPALPRFWDQDGLGSPATPLCASAKFRFSEEERGLSAEKTLFAKLQKPRRALLRGRGPSEEGERARAASRGPSRVQRRACARHSTVAQETRAAGRGGGFHEVPRTAPSAHMAFPRNTFPLEGGQCETLRPLLGHHRVPVKGQVRHVREA